MIVDCIYETTQYGCECGLYEEYGHADCEYDYNNCYCFLDHVALDPEKPNSYKGVIYDRCVHSTAESKRIFVYDEKAKVFEYDEEQGIVKIGRRKILIADILYLSYNKGAGEVELINRQKTEGK